jgi:hypothetical protein
VASGGGSWISLAAAAVLLACGGSAQEGSRTVELGPDVKVVLETDAPFVNAGDFTERMRDTTDVALAYWGGTWGDMAGRTITLVDAPYVPCHGAESLGCTAGDIVLTTRDPGVGTVSCIEETVLVHEIGHAVIGDPDHLDPRWMQMDEVAEALGGHLGYAAGGTVPCPTYVSVWRHPLGSP